jgi:hypothetical protein
MSAADLRCREAFVEPLGYGVAANDRSAMVECGRGGSYAPPLVSRAYKDPVILEDRRVFTNMLDMEEFYVAATNYFQSNQTEIKPHMRKIVTDWMLEVRG